MRCKAELLKKQGEFFLRLAELTYVGLAVGGFVAWGFEKKINLLQLVLVLLVGMGVVWGFFWWGSRLYRKGLEEDER